jgi:erythromycin esterase-like protein
MIEIVDGDTMQVLGIAMVSGTVKSAIRTGMKEQADGVAKAIEDLLKQHHTKPAKEEARSSAQGGAPQKGFKLPWSK